MSFEHKPRRIVELEKVPRRVDLFVNLAEIPLCDSRLMFTTAWSACRDFLDRLTAA